LLHFLQVFYQRGSTGYFCTFDALAHIDEDIIKDMIGDYFVKGMVFLSCQEMTGQIFKLVN